MFEPGEIFEFSYLWHREKMKNEESGRKDRPVCLAITTDKSLFLFPITHQPPLAGQKAIEISEIELRRGGLTLPSWLVIDELNYTTRDNLVDFKSIAPQGAFSEKFVRHIGERIKALREAGRLKAVKRD